MNGSNWALLVWVALLCSGKMSMAQSPVNDSCSNALTIVITGKGYDYNTFTSATADLSKANVQPEETFAPAILVAGQSKKSVWYKFTLPTTRSICLCTKHMKSPVSQSFARGKRQAFPRSIGK